MRFTKLYAAGKDFICVDDINDTQPYIVEAIARAICDRHFGAGADGVLLLDRSKRTDMRVRSYLPNGGVGIAEPISLCCAAEFARLREIARQPQLRIETGPDIAYLNVENRAGNSTRIRIDLGPPMLQADRIPTTLPGSPPVEVPVTFPDTMHNVTAVGLGGAHAVIFVRELSDALVHDVGPQMEKHPGFPQRATVAFVKVNRPGDVSARVWERNARRPPPAVPARPRSPSRARSRAAPSAGSSSASHMAIWKSTGIATTIMCT
jgi:diaminopimelate epimerase